MRFSSRCLLSSFCPRSRGNERVRMRERERSAHPRFPPFFIPIRPPLSLSRSPTSASSFLFSRSFSSLFLFPFSSFCAVELSRPPPPPIFFSILRAEYSSARLFFSISKGFSRWAITSDLKRLRARAREQSLRHLYAGRMRQARCCDVLRLGENSTRRGIEIEFDSGVRASARSFLPRALHLPFPRDF